MVDGIPLVALPQRNPTLESGIDRADQFALRNVGTSNGRSHDRVQILLAKRLLTSSNAKSSSHIRLLQRDYARIKDRRAEHRPKQPSKRFSLLKPSSRTTERLSCDKLFSYWLISAPGISAQSGNGTTHVHPKSTFSEWACRIAVNLETQQQNTLQLVSMTESPGEELTSFMFSSWHFFLATVSGRLGSIYQIPVRVLQVTIAEYWGVDMVMIPGTVAEDDVDASLSRPRPLRPPSMRSVKGSEGHSGSPSNFVWGKDSTRPGNLDPSRGDHEILLTWRRSVTRFDSDLAMYIWEYHKSIPEVDYAKIVLRPRSPAQQQERLLISFRSSRSNELFFEMRNTTVKEAAGHSDTTASNQTSWSPLYETLVSICIVFELMISDTVEFLEACDNEVSRVNILGRQNPSTSKMRFLMHLEDCRKVAHYGVRHALEVLGSLGQWAKRKQILPDCQQRLDVVQEDLQYLDQELEKLEGNIRNDKNMLRQHLQLSSDMTGFRLTLLAGIFLPLSFTTSIFGMNIENPTEESLEALSNFTNTVLYGLPVDVRNSTQALVSSVAKSGPLTYDWTTFAITSLCVLATLPFTLTIGFVLRSLVVLSAKYIVYWRAALVVIGMPFALMSMFGSFIGHRFLLRSQELRLKAYEVNPVETYDGYPGIGSRRLSPEIMAASVTCRTVGITFLMVYWTLNGVLFVSLLGRTYRAWGAKRQRVFWVTVSLATVVCSMVESMPQLPLRGELQSSVNFPLMENGGESPSTLQISSASL
ncbi:hypothetical protein PG990_011718 [Apiospora arundinis]